ncbi:hypothetical protein Q765_02910 [Flavobacterium rivuli WB 3.3-2 = DSM 21788]|uniref:NTF2 fold immunity protein domain-containing protein n=1 Tax=Flavobacterium rivuli WB 3.3-2 = DSM 21788 TaxID=1121895 RepID=A0A0A2M999_9FLAO|nr:hypothetical protein [Flavobacterium rivuli]KGO88028.1 hypothetical protein Q765_02910 [Flavobacterium rivuli WB 3.3-2 = DSM 21788]
MKYTYDTPEEAVASLEKAYSNEDINAIILCKDFIEEAKFILEQTVEAYNLENIELIEETAKALESSLVLTLQENGFPNFKNLKSEIFNLQRFKDNIYVVDERVTYPDNTIYETRIFLSFKNGVWKVALVEE